MKVVSIVLVLGLLSFALSQTSCDIVIAGGTLASLGAAIHAPDSYKTCLIEPTSRLGGQLGDQGVWHIDFNWLYQKDYPDRTIAYNPANIHPFLAEICEKCNTGDCWVSRNCFQYSCIEPLIRQQLAQKKNLTIYYDTTIKSVQKTGSKITGVQIIQRLPIALQEEGGQARQDCRYFSESLDDWYTREPSQYYRKVVSKLTVNNFIIEATQYGDVLVLSNASYMQGTANKSTCGQSIVFGVQETLGTNSTSRIEEQALGKGVDDDFSLSGYTAEQVWRYRRLVGKGLGIKPNEISLQNWNGPGNDYKGGYLFIEANKTTYDWKGGLNYTTLKQAQLRTLRYHEWFKQVSGQPLLAIYKNETKTCRGTTRLPYIRDGRRSVGYKGFFMVPEDVTGNYAAGGPLTGTIFPDRVAIGMYNMDLHSINNCSYGPYAQNYPLPFFLPLRAFSNLDYDNLIAAGRAMSEQFFVSSATRTHATELASGAASMAIAIYMKQFGVPSVWALIGCTPCWDSLRAMIRQLMPVEWTINGEKYPNAMESKLMESSQ